jgi:hypothetical protein
MAAPSTIQSGDQLGELNINGYDGTGMFISAQIRADAASTWHSGDHGTTLRLRNTKAGTNNLADQMVLNSDGSVSVTGKFTNAPTASVVSAATVDLGAQGANVIFVSGTTDISSFHGATGDVFDVIFTGGPLAIVDSGNLALYCNGRKNLLVNSGCFGGGDRIRVEFSATNICQVIAYNPGQFMAYEDGRPSAGYGPVYWVVGKDNTTSSPDFAVDQRATITKTRAKSILLSSAGDTTDLGQSGEGGTPASPALWTGVAPHGLIYSWAPDFAFSIGSSPSQASYSPRFAQSYCLQTETPTTSVNYLRGGALAIGATRRNKTVGDMSPPDIAYFMGGDASANGGGSIIALGRASWEDSGQYQTAYNYATTGTFQGSTKDVIFNFSGATAASSTTQWTLRNNLAVGNIVAAASDMNAQNFSAISIRKYNDWTTGWDQGYDSTLGLVDYTVSGNTWTGRWYRDGSGNYLPVTSNQVSIGSSSKRVQNLFGNILDINRNDASTPAGKIVNSNTGFNQDVLQVDCSTAASAAYHFYRSAANGVVQYNLYGNGNGKCAGSWTGGGVGFAELLEWADLNPTNEDRVGFTVVFDETKTNMIRKATGTDVPVGVVSGRPGMVGNAAALYWKDLYVLDDWGRKVMQDVQYIQWSETTKVSQQVATQQVVTKTVAMPQMEDYQDTHESSSLQEVDGKWTQVVQTTAVTKQRPVTQRVQVYDAMGSALLDGQGAPVYADVPVMRDVETTDIQTVMQTVEIDGEVIQHSYKAGAIPNGLTAPPDAVTVTVQEPVINPDYDPSQTYIPREDRPEWAVVSFLGQELVRADSPKGSSWVKMGDVKTGIEEWLVR